VGKIARAVSIIGFDQGDFAHAEANRVGKGARKH